MIFHWTLLLIIIGHVRVITGIPLVQLGIDEAFGPFSSAIGGLAGMVILGATFYLIHRRITVGRVREVSSTGDYFALVLILMVILTGDAMRFFEHIDLNVTREYFWGLFTFNPVPIQNGAFMLHFLCGQILLIYIPFSKILHLGGIFFSKPLLKRH